MNLSAYVSGIGVLGPGLPNWPETASVLSGRVVYSSARTNLPTPALLPPAALNTTLPSTKGTTAKGPAKPLNEDKGPQLK